MRVAAHVIDADHLEETPQGVERKVRGARDCGKYGTCGRCRLLSKSMAILVCAG